MVTNAKRMGDAVDGEWKFISGSRRQRRWEWKMGIDFDPTSVVRPRLRVVLLRPLAHRLIGGITSRGNRKI